MAFFDKLKQFGSNIYGGLKDILFNPPKQQPVKPLTGLTASISNLLGLQPKQQQQTFYAPFGDKPTPEQQQLIRTYPQLSSPPLGPGQGIEVFKIPSPGSPEPQYNFIPPRPLIPFSGDSILGAPSTPLPQTPTVTQP